MKLTRIALLPLSFALSACDHKPVTTIARRPAPAIISVKPGRAMEPLRTWQAHSGTAWTINFSSDGKRLATAGGGGKAKEWDTADGRLIREFAPGGSPTYSGDGRFFAVDGNDGIYPHLVPVVRVWNAATGQVLQTLPGRQDQTERGFMQTTLKFTLDNRFLIEAGSEGMTTWSVTDWHLQSKSADVMLAPPPQGGTQYVLLHGKKVGVYTIGPNGAPRLVRSLPFITTTPGNTPELALSPDGRLITLVTTRKVQLQEDGEKFEINQPVADLRDTATGRRLNVFGPPADYNRAFSPDSRTLATWSFDSGDRSDRLRFWNVRTGQVKEVAKPYGNDLICAAFSPNGKMLATGNASGEVSLWRVPQW